MENTGSSLKSKIAWGALIGGAGVAVAAVVGFTFFPEAAGATLEAVKTALTAGYDKIGDFGAWMTENVIGRGEEGGVRAVTQDALTGVYNSIREMGVWISTNVVGTMKDPELLSKVTTETTPGWFSSLVAPYAGTPYHAGAILADSAQRAVDAKVMAGDAATGLVKFIMNHKIISAAGAGLGAYAVANMSSEAAKQQEYAAHAAQMKESFAVREDMRKMQAVMTMRAALAGHPQAQALMAQQNGRG